MTLDETIERLVEMRDLEAKGYEDRYFRRDVIEMLTILMKRFGPDMVSNGYVDAGS